MALDPSRCRYDEKTRVLVYEAGVSGKGLVQKDILVALSKVQRDKVWLGKVVDRVQVRLGDRTAAQANVDALAFMGLGCASPDGPLESRAKFSVRKDFGIEE